MWLPSPKMSFPVLNFVKTQYVFFCAWFYSLDTLSVKFTHSVLHSRHLFTFIAIPHVTDYLILLFSYPLSCWWEFGLFSVWGSSAMCILVHTFWWDTYIHPSVGCIFRNCKISIFVEFIYLEYVEFLGNRIYVLLALIDTVKILQNGCTNLHPYQQ